MAAIAGDRITRRVVRNRKSRSHVPGTRTVASRRETSERSRPATTRTAVANYAERDSNAANACDGLRSLTKRAT
jgi:hypothetical protein